MTSIRLVTLVALLGSLLMVVAPDAAAHSYGYTTDGVWKIPELTFYWDVAYPRNSSVWGPWQDRAMEGRSNWTIAATGRPPVQFVDEGLSYAHDCSQPGTYGKNTVDAKQIDGGGGLGALTCVSILGTTVTNARIAIDSIEGDWYTQNATPVPSTHVDLESVMTHEFGHVYSFNGGNVASEDLEGHFDTTIAVCTGPVTDDATMCPSVGRGEHWPRSPDIHDTHTMLEAYNELA